MSTNKIGVMTTLSTGVVIDRSQTGSLSSEKLSQLFSDAHQNGSGRVIIVDDAKRFFNIKNLIQLVNSGDQKFDLVAEFFGVVISESEIQVFAEARRIRDRIVGSLNKYQPVYTFAEMPNDWSVETHLKITGSAGRQYIRRAPDGYYKVTASAVKRIWDHAKYGWSEGKSIEDMPKASYDGHWKAVRFTDIKADIGCQTVHRYEIEQLALHFGWDFP